MNDLKNIDRYVRAWLRLFRMFNPSCDVPMSMDNSILTATTRCYNDTHYGRRKTLNRDPEDQTELARALDNAKGKCDCSDEPFEEADYIEAEGRWIEKWKDPTGQNRERVRLAAGSNAWPLARPPVLYAPSRVRRICQL